MRARILSILLLFTGLSAVFSVSAQPLTVGVTDSPPFSYKDESGQWQGISIGLWSAVAEELALEYTFEEMRVDELVDGLAADEVDVGAAALVITRDREEVLNFSHPFFASGISVATQAQQTSMVISILRKLITREFMLAAGALGLVLLGVGFVIWLVERRRNPEQFGGTNLEGIGSGFWWSAVTMTTVGYGDKAPVSALGRFVGLIWMFASIIVISGFTGAIASALTVSGLSPAIQSFDDLRTARVGVIEGSASARLLDRERVRYVTFPGTREGLAAVADGRLDGFVNDAPILMHFVQKDYGQDLIVLPQTFDQGYYAFALSESFEDLEALNLAMLNFRRSEAWEDLVYTHLGQ